MSPVLTANPVSSADSSSTRRVSVATAVATLPTAATALAMVALFFTVGPSPVPNAATLVYGLANVAVVGALYRRLPGEARRSIFRYERPSRGELAVAVGLAVVAIGAVGPVVVRVASALELSGGTSVAALDSPLGALVVAVGSVLIAPIAEEVLFRGLLFGVLLPRYDGRIAVLGSSAVFGAIHVFLAGLPGVVESFLIGIGFAVARYRYDNLAGVGVSHALVNAYYVAVGIGPLPSLLPA